GVGTLFEFLRMGRIRLAQPVRDLVHHPLRIPWRGPDVRVQAAVVVVMVIAMFVVSMIIVRMLVVLTVVGTVIMIGIVVVLITVVVLGVMLCFGRDGLSLMEVYP